MSIKVEYQIIHSFTDDIIVDGDYKDETVEIKINIKDKLIDFLAEVLYDYVEKEDYEEVNEMININYVSQRNNGEFILGISIMIDEFKYENIEDIINSFGQELSNDENINLVVKYIDEGMWKKHQEYAKEIFEFEMKIREILSFIFLNTYEDEYYDLLSEVKVKTQSQNGGKSLEYYKNHFENDFFFLLFSDYSNLDKLKKIKRDDLIEKIKNNNDYNELQQDIITRGVNHEQYKDFLLKLKEVLNPIENVRNSIAHNRSISNRALENYEHSKEKLNEFIEEFWSSL